MNAYFEDAKSLEYSMSLKHPFYSFINGTKHNSLPIEAHWHYYIEILYIIEGRGNVILNGVPLVAKKGDILFIMPRDVHAIDSISSEVFNYTVAKFDPSILFDSAQETFTLIHILPVAQPLHPGLKHIEAAKVDPIISEYLSKINELYISGEYGFELLVKSYLLQVFHYFMQHLSNNKIRFNFQNISGVDVSPIMPAFNYMHTHYTKNITAKDLAKHCHLSYSYFSRLFKKITGITFTQYLNFMRINEAEKMLMELTSSVTEVAYKVGFTDTSYFIKQFKLYKQLTPKQYMKNVVSARALSGD